MHPVFDRFGQMGPVYEATDWEATPFGPVSTWSPTLLSVVDLMMHTRFPITLLWGPEFTLIYNEAYVPLIADKHPEALGQPAELIFPEAWDLIGPMMEAVSEGRGATWLEDKYVPLYRRGFLEECYFTFSYSPVPNGDGVIEGVMDIATETTEQVISRRRLRLLSQLAERLADAQDVEEVPVRALPVLRADFRDFPAVDIRLHGMTREADQTVPGSPGGGSGVVLGQVEDHSEGLVVRLPIGSPDSGDTSHLAVSLSPLLAPDEQYLGFLRLVAASLRQTLDRAHARSAERRAAATRRSIAEAFQRSLLIQPSRTKSPAVAVRYQPAAELAQVGGDWYDVFELPDASLTVMVGDVAGHDRRAAVGMAQVRNMTRGVAFAAHPDAPSRVLKGLDRAMCATARDIIATAVLAQVKVNGSESPTMTWSNAGHLPPVVIEPDGGTRLLERAPDLLLGFDENVDRIDHHLTLGPGATVVMYTDGLIERRQAPISTGLDWLLAALHGKQHLDVEELCDYILCRVGAEALQDDIVLLALRV